MEVFIYRNLTKKCWSIRACAGPQRGKVIHHVTSWTLRDAKFKVSQAGRNRVLAERCKNVHAGVSGELLSWKDLAGASEDGSIWYPFVDGLQVEEITYDPYKWDSFVTANTYLTVHSARIVKADGSQVFAHRIT